MRDKLPLGEVEILIRDSDQDAEISFTNGYLAQYAENLAKRLK